MGLEPGLVSREKNGTIKCLHDHFGGADGTVYGHKVYALSFPGVTIKDVEAPQATMTTATTGGCGWVASCAEPCGSSSTGTRIFQ